METLGSRLRLGSRRVASLGLLLIGFGQVGCKGLAGTPEPEEVRDPITGLTQAEEREVLAKVGEKPITLGDYARTLARMDEFERLRYQTPERQAELLDEIVNAELLAQEAERRGLD
jgi:hypothetical protein